MNAVIISVDGSVKIVNIAEPVDKNLELILGGEIRYRTLQDSPFANYPACVAKRTFGYEDGLSFNYVASVFSGYLVFGDAAIVYDLPDEEFPSSCFIMSYKTAEEYAEEARNIIRHPEKYRKYEEMVMTYLYIRYPEYGGGAT